LLPDVVICGAPRCGTTSLYSYLRAHPQVRVPDDPRGGDGRLNIDRDPHGLFDERALPRVLAQSNRPRLLLILRNPCERLQSLFRQARDEREELPPDYDFDTFVGQLIDGSFPRRFGGGLADQAAALQQGQYVRFIEPLWREVPDRVVVVFAENMARYPRTFMIGVARRLQLDPTFYDSFAFGVENSSLKLRNRWLNRVAGRLQGWFLPVASEDTRRRLDHFYAEDNAALFDLLGVPRVAGWPV